MNGEVEVPSLIRGRPLAISNYRRRRISSIKRRTIHKNRWIYSSIEVPPFCRSIDIRIGHPHSYNGFSSIKAHRKKREMMGEGMMEMKNEGVLLFRGGSILLCEHCYSHFNRFGVNIFRKQIYNPQNYIYFFIHSGTSLFNVFA